MYFYSYWLFQRVNLTNIQHLSVKFNVPPVQQLPQGWWWKKCIFGGILSDNKGPYGI